MKKTRGIFVISTFFIVGILMVEIGITLAIVSFFRGQASADLRYANEARAAAESGIEDAIVKVIYNKNCPDGTCSSSYTLSISNATSTLEICKDTCTTAGQTQITSTGSSFNRTIRLRAVLNVNSTTGNVQLISINEL